MGSEPEDDELITGLSEVINPDGTDCAIDWSLEFAAADDGEITPERAAKLAQHIARCDRCRLMYAIMLNDKDRDDEGEDQA
jgi:hypothetical protein